jgi:nucleotide-binding universal stress UspA family protein
MLTVKKILCPTDFSEASLSGLEYGVEIASLFQAELKVLYVLPVSPPRPATPGDPLTSYEIPEYEPILHKESEKHLQAIIAQRVPESVKVAPRIANGKPAYEIVRIAEEEKVDLIVIATQGHTGWHHFVVGSVAEKVIQMAPCPVLAVREARRAKPSA